METMEAVSRLEMRWFAPRQRQERKTISSKLQKQDAWSYCALSRSQLTAPLVSDGYGKLYNKESILTYLLEPSEFAGDASKQMAHVTSMKDIVVLQLTRSGDKYICEVTRRDMDGATPFVYLTPCGHALAKAALSHSDDRVCPVCDKAFGESDIIPINPEETDNARLQSRLEALGAEGLTHSGAPMRKKKRKVRATGDDETPKTAETKKTKVVKESAVQSDALQSIFHKPSGQEQRDVSFMNRGTVSRIA